MKRWFGRFANWVPPLLGLVLFGVSVWTIQQELSQHDLQDIWQKLRDIPPRDVVMAIALVGVNYGVLTGHDALALRYIQHSLPYRKTALVSAISFAVSNAVGITVLSGGAIRYRFYTAWGLSNSQVAQIIAFCSISFWLGLLTMGGVLFVSEAIQIPEAIALPFASLQSVGLMALVVVGVYLLLCGRFGRSLKLGSVTIPPLSWPMAIAQISLTCCDWVVAALTLYALLETAQLPPFPTFYGIFIFAKLAGVISSVPGGLGVFETVILLTLSPPIPSVTLLGTLLIFRVIHFFLPLAIALVALGLYELRQMRHRQN
ncbi:MAG: lysylphosphatidylglycerol synthase domain-containing protein [Elainellaceae cyanobacterium]